MGKTLPTVLNRSLDFRTYYHRYSNLDFLKKIHMTTILVLIPSELLSEIKGNTLNQTLDTLSSRNSVLIVECQADINEEIYSLGKHNDKTEIYNAI